MSNIFSVFKAVKVWFVIVFIGQFIFGSYICAQYFIKMLSGGMADWSESSTGGYVNGDIVGNVSFIVHVLLAMIITIGGPLQLIPFVRNKYTKFHRYNGRIYVVSAVIISLAGFYLIWVRGTIGDTLAHVITSINGAIIILAAIYTVRYAMIRKIDLHNDWALRLFLAMSGVFFFRLFFNFWLIISGGSGIDFGSFTGLPLDIIGFCAYIAPQIVISVYFKIQRGSNQRLIHSMTFFMITLTIICLIGIIGATIIMWWPHISING